MKEKSDQTNNGKSNKIKHVSFVLGAGMLLSIVGSSRVILLCVHILVSNWGPGLAAVTHGGGGEQNSFCVLS